MSSAEGTGRNGADRSKSDVVVDVEGLRKTFGALVAADDTAFQIARGTITGLIGPNGAGKSTVYNLVTGFNEPTAGLAPNTAGEVSDDVWEVNKSGTAIIKFEQNARRGLSIADRGSVLNQGTVPPAGDGSPHHGSLWRAAVTTATIVLGFQCFPGTRPVGG
jgi:ABC-type branched-subunit amino acid transport system ATPase component